MLWKWTITIQCTVRTHLNNKILERWLCLCLNLQYSTVSVFTVEILKAIKYVYFSLDPVLKYCKCFFYTNIIMTDMLQVLWKLVNNATSPSKDRCWTVQLHGQLDNKRKCRLSDGRHANKPPSKYLLYVSWLVVKLPCTSKFVVRTRHMYLVFSKPVLLVNIIIFRISLITVHCAILFVNNKTLSVQIF